jgi:hypothetical protein
MMQTEEELHEGVDIEPFVRKRANVPCNKHTKRKQEKEADDT